MLLNYRKLGEGNPVFILHGLFGLSDNWATVGKMLSEIGYEVYLIDLRNHGSSPHSEEWTYAAMMEDIKNTMVDVLGIMENGKETSAINHQPLPILIGHSLGGKVAMQFASTYPEMLEKLIIVDMAPKDYPENQFSFIEKLLALDITKMKSRKEAETELKKIISDNATIQLLLKNIQWTPLPLPLSSREGSDSQILKWKFNLKVIAGNQDKIGKTFIIKNKVETPALFIRGERSNYILDTDIEEIRKTFINSEFKTITGAGHWVHADKAEEFVNAVTEFIG